MCKYLRVVKLDKVFSEYEESLCLLLTSASACVPGEPGCSSAGQAEAAQGSTGFTICKLVV